MDDEVFWRKDGTCFPVEYTSTPIIEDGKILGAVVTYKDVTDRKRLEKVLRQSEERYRSIFESVASLIISVDEEGTEAAAATAVVMVTSAPPPGFVTVTVDRPFIYLIRDIQTGAILFLGRVLNPAA